MEGESILSKNVKNETSTSQLSFEEAKKEANMIKGIMGAEKEIKKTNFPVSIEDIKKTEEFIDKLKIAVEKEPDSMKDRYKLYRILYRISGIVGIPIALVEQIILGATGIWKKLPPRYVIDNNGDDKLEASYGPFTNLYTDLKNKVIDSAELLKMVEKVGENYEKSSEEEILETKNYYEKSKANEFISELTKRAKETPIFFMDHSYDGRPIIRQALNEIAKMVGAPSRLAEEAFSSYAYETTPLNEKQKEFFSKVKEIIDSSNPN